jgi:hypothetical protein
MIRSSLCIALFSSLLRKEGQEGEFIPPITNYSILILYSSPLPRLNRGGGHEEKVLKILYSSPFDKGRRWYSAILFSFF